MFRVKFKDDHEKEIYTVYCKTEDLNLAGHPYFVSINRLLDSSTHSPILEINNKEKKRFRDTKALMIPIQNVILIETLMDEKPRIMEIQPIIVPKNINQTHE